MKTYQIYIFTQENCFACDDIKAYIAELPESDQKEIKWADFLQPRPSQPYARGPLSKLATYCGVKFTPTLVVCHEEVACKIEDDEEFCEPVEVIVESVIGAKLIKESYDQLV